MKQNPPITAAYRNFYENFLSSGRNNQALVDLWGENPLRFETQINCKSSGTKLDSQKWEDGGEIFGPTRWPYDADKPTARYSDPPITYIIENRVKAIGSTWWDWKNKQTIMLGFDFDSILDHSDSVGISPEAIARLDNIDVPYLEIYKSTRGNGRHIYVKFAKPYPVTKTHSEHKAVARSLMAKLSKDTGFDFDGNRDCFGAILWFYHIGASDDGYSLIKPATSFLTANDVPPGWDANIEVVSGSRTKVRVQGWTPDGTETEGDELDEMSQAAAKVKLDKDHLRILDALDDTGYTSVWVPDHHLWQGHTHALKKVYDDFKEAGTPLKGLYATNSPDTDPGKPNCFMRPQPNGAWDVFRFGDNVAEDDLWDEVGNWTHTTFNFPATLHQICMSCGGFEGTEDKHGYFFNTVADLEAAIELLEASPIEIPQAAYDNRQLSLVTRGKDIILIIDKKRADTKDSFPRFVKTARGWEIKLKNTVKVPDEEIKREKIFMDLDTKIRALKVENGKSYHFDSWVLRDNENEWVTHPRENIKNFMQADGYPKPEPVLGDAIASAWKVVNMPFYPEYPGGRVWNKEAAQFAFQPVKLGPDEIPHHPNWDRLMNHCGVELNEYIPDLDWCEEWGIKTGGDYLTAWVACMFQKPFCKLPYLFMYGPQKSGKSTFHEAICMLLTRGWGRADRAMTSDQGYNGELEDVVFAIVDEIDIAKAGMAAYNKLKDWVTATHLLLHTKYKTPRTVRNTLHFVQMANSRSNVPVFPGDKRVVVMNVPSPEKEIPKEVFMESLRNEAPHFMHTLLNWDIAVARSREALPLIETQGKIDASEARKDELTSFVEQHCYKVSGHAIKFSDFTRKFYETLDEVYTSDWKDNTIASRLSEMGYPVGRSPKLNQRLVGNLTFNPKAKKRSPYTISNGNLLRENDE